MHIPLHSRQKKCSHAVGSLSTEQGNNHSKFKPSNQTNPSRHAKIGSYMYSRSSKSRTKGKASKLSERERERAKREREREKERKMAVAKMKSDLVTRSVPCSLLLSRTMLESSLSWAPVLLRAVASVIFYEHLLERENRCFESRDTKLRKIGF